MFKRYPQLQSGFLGPTENHLEIPSNPPQSPFGALILQNPTRTQQDLFYSPVIDSLYNEIIQDPLKLRSFDFVGSSLKTIHEVFGKQHFSSFIHLQEENPGISQHHIDFLAETIEIALGYKKQRAVSVQTWASFLSAANKGVGNFKSAVLLRNFPSLKDFSTDGFYLSWIQNQSVSDVIVTTHAIFGRRSVHAVQGGTF